MTYIDVAWHHNHSTEPVRLVSELDSGRYELRKLEFFGDGRVAFATGLKQSSGTRLGEMPVPEEEEINRDRQFTAKSITQEEFEALWIIHTGRNHVSGPFKITETFEITGRGVVVVIAETVDLGVGKKLAATITKSDGSSFPAVAMQEWLLQREPAPVEHAAFLLAGVNKLDVPLGSTVEFNQATQ